MPPSVTTSAQAPQLTVSRSAPASLVLQLGGFWRTGQAIPTAAIVRSEVEAERTERILFDTTNVSAWDSTLVAFVARVLDVGRTAGVAVERGGLPAGVQRLLELVEVTPAPPSRPKPRRSGLARIGLRALDRHAAVKQLLVAIGELSIALVNWLTGTATFQRRELWVQMQAAGAGALGIVGLVAGLVGLIIAFISAVQLQTFGAELYVASLVGIAMVRDLAAVMAGVVIAGRTGAAFAAELGTMRVTQEIDALKTLGLSPVEFLALPRVLAVTLMMPLLTIYADLIGVLGGAMVGIGAMSIPPGLYFDQTFHAVSLTDLIGGVIKATTYGFLIGVAGCFIGLRSGRSAAAVGKAATSAVVAGIVLVIAACGLYAVLFYRLEI
jgi:phospholipid/cholesterol/gamma-HCH transport system permease protein